MWVSPDPSGLTAHSPSSVRNTNHGPVSDSGPSGGLGASVALSEGDEGVPASESEVRVEVGGMVGCESGGVESVGAVQPAVMRITEIEIMIERTINLDAGRKCR